MKKFFRNGSLMVQLRMSSMTTGMGVLTGLAAAGLASPAQVQAQTTQNRLVITNVEVDYAQGQMFIYGRNFTTPTGAAPVVHFMEIGMDVKTYGPSTVVVTLPTVLQRPGAYLLTMSTGSNLEQNDSFDVTLGAVGPKGDKGDKGDPGYTGALACRVVAGPGVNSYSMPGSYASCGYGETLTGGACYSNSPSFPVESRVMTVSGQLAYACALRATTSTTVLVYGQAICCKVQ